MEDNKSFEWSTNARFDLLIRPIFLISLALLLSNDFYLKYEYANWGTGKLSGRPISPHTNPNQLHPQYLLNPHDSLNREIAIPFTQEFTV